MSNRVVETLYRLRDGTTEVLRRISGAYGQNAQSAETASQRIEAANRRQRSSLSGVLAKVSRLRFAYFAVAGVIFGATRAIANFTRAASDQENAEARLTAAIRNGAGATEDQIESLRDLAAQRQRVTRFSDEQTISAQAQLATFRLTAEEIALLTPRIQDLAEGQRRLGRQNVDLEQSAILVGRALTGGLGALSRYGVVLSDAQREAFRFGTRSEQLGVIVEALDDNFKGLAESLTPFEQATNNVQQDFGDLRETLGGFITQSEGAQDAVKGLSDAIVGLGEALSDNGAAVNKFITGTVATFRVLGNTVALIFDGINFGFNKFATGLLQGASQLFRAFETVTFGAVSDRLNQFVAQTDGKIAELEQSAAERFERMGRSADRFIAAGDDLNDVLFNTARAQEAANAVSREALDLEQKRQQELNLQREALERTNATLQQLGVDAEKVETGISTAARNTTESLLRLAEDGQTSLEVLSAAAERASSSFDDKDVEFFNQALQRAQEQGKITTDQLRALRVSVEDAGDSATSLDQITASLANISDLQDLNKAAQDIRRLGEEGKLTAEEVALLEAEINQVTNTIRAAGSNISELGKQGRESAADMQVFGDTIEDIGARTQTAGRAIATLLNNLRGISEGANVAVDQFVNNLPNLQSVNGFLRRLSQFTEQLTRDFEEQTAAAERWIAELDGGGEALLQTAEAALKSSEALNLIDTRTLDQLEAAAKAARGELEAMRAEAERGVQSLEEELLRLEGRTDEIERRRLGRRRDEIEQQLKSVDLDRETRAALEEQLRLMDQIVEKRTRQEEVTRGSDTREKGRANDMERAAEAAEREARARQATSAEQVRRIVLEVIVNQQGDLQLSQRQIQQISQTVLAQLERDSERV